jgi:hypothetical protein
LDTLLKAIEEKGGAVDRALLLDLLIKHDLAIVRRAKKKEGGAQ